MDRPFFSIVIPTRQSGNKVGRCLQSIIDQTFESFEVLLQDGLSSDDTILVAQSFCDHRVKIVSKKDNGPFDAMNQALSRTAGTWILFMGCEDVLFERGSLASIYDIASVSEASVLYGNVILASDNNCIKDGAIYKGKTDLPSLFSQNLSLQSCLYHKHIFADGVRFNLAYPVLAGFDLNLLCFAKYKTGYTPLIIAISKTKGIESKDTDELFEVEKWQNIITYFGNQIKQPNFMHYRGFIKKAGIKLIRRGEFSVGLIAFSIYLYLKWLKMKKTT